MDQSNEAWYPSPEDEEASKSSLSLSPRVAARAEPFRLAHLAARAAETLEQSQKKAAAWRRGENSPRTFSCA